jgi:hypothetical protein
MLIDTRCLRFPLMLTLFCALVLPARTETSGAVSSNAPNTPSETNSSSAKPLPWKFLASPMGLLGPNWTSAMFRGFNDPGNWDCRTKPNDCTPRRVSELVDSTLGIDLEKEKPTYVSIHVVDYGSTPADSISDSWYLYHSKDHKWSFQEFTGQRLYGTPTILFLFIHLNAKGLNAGWENAPGINAGEASDRRLEWDALQHNMGIPNPADAKHPVPLCADGTTSHFQWVGSGAVVTTYSNVHYEAAVVKRTPANISNLLDILKILKLAQSAEPCKSISTEQVNIWGAGRIQNIGLPSDVNIAGYLLAAGQPLTVEERTTTQIGSVGAFNDEQLYWWDASIGVPVSQVKDLNYSTSDNTVVASQVSIQTAYAMFNLMPHPVNLSDPRSNMWPRILLGFPLSSSPWEKLFAGGGIGVPLKQLKYFQIFGGAVFSRSPQPTTLSAGSTATNAQLQNNLRISTTPKFLCGINIPVKSVLDKLLK